MRLLAFLVASDKGINFNFAYDFVKKVVVILWILSVIQLRYGLY